MILHHKSASTIYCSILFQADFFAYCDFDPNRIGQFQTIFFQNMLHISIAFTILISKIFALIRCH